MVIEWTRLLGVQLVHRLTIFGFTLLTLFFLLRDGPSLLEQAATIIDRMFGTTGTRLSIQVLVSVRATLNGLVLVGLGEGLLLGIAYALCGLPHPVLLGALTALLAMVPFGAPLIYSVGALVLVGQSQTSAAIALFAFGSALVFVADHFVRPILIGGATRLPFLWILLGIFGGLETFGLLGLFLGPAVMASLMAVWREWSGEIAQPLPSCRVTPRRVSCVPPPARPAASGTRGDYAGAPSHSRVFSSSRCCRRSRTCLAGA